ncbi:hypothetical protein SLEP1_g2364 [Rubroshorea leprosula]|uniref:Ferric oxidoreductase domain-containing protein n=1 Tax=Rubroshorea leprosula TaxID=152421 RepID=A0AAV5HMU8_9ROSI|nr:hypothetical protein SLEP1_g2364 [Rubroshorea leprosula]
MDASIRMVRAAMKGLLLVMFLGILMMWVMMPTNTYREKWRVKISDKVSNSTYLGTSGLNILIWTFPMLFISVLGSLYLHLGKKLNNNDVSQCSDDGEGHRRAATWKKPVLVKGPLGIVTGTELAFLIMFIALLVWSLSTDLHNNFANITQFAQQGQRIWVEKLKITALYLGVVGNICLAFLFFPVARGSSVLPLLGLTSEGSIKYHIWLGHMVMAIFTAHGFGFILAWSIDHQFSEVQ